jgi:hypothetical protein
MGKGKDPNAEALDHQTTPLSTLKDPASFGPPPRRTLAGTPDSGVLGAPVPSPTRAQRQAEKEAEEEANKPPPGPYRANTTGIDPSTLPKPPMRRPGQLEAPPPPPSRGTTSAPKPKPKPKLPPRLPPRQNSFPDTHAEAPPPTYNESTQDNGPAQGYLNQSALERLGKSGVSVPGFGIGRTASPPLPPRRNTASPTKAAFAPPAGAGRGPQLSELQTRFSKMATPSAGAQASGEQASPGRRTASTLAQKYGVSNVGHGSAATVTPSQAASGLETANGLAQKYGMASRASPVASPLQSPTYGGFGKKPAPPPPPKKKELVANSTGEPPPIPMGSKPKF